ncbi:acyltransferase [Cryomorphaceae bacterium 1068]|nr:acyltransferase [Cryomorphaceae bacterium 1068]
MTRFFEYLLYFRYRFNGWLVSIYLGALGCKVGKGLKCLRLPSFKDIPKGNIRIGDNVSVGKGVIFEIARTGSLNIGERCTLGDYSRYSSIDEISIGKAVAIAEHVSIRGSFHKTDRDQNIIDQGDEGAPISIGNDVLLGAQTVVLMGVSIPDGVVIGSQSLVRKSDKVHPYGIFAGSPLNHIRDRR